MAGLRALIAGFAAWVGGGLGLVAAAGPPPLEAYGDLPKVREISISPDGTRLGVFREAAGKDILQVIDRQGNFIAGLDTSEVRGRGSYFASNDAMVLRASERETMFGYRGDFEYSASFGFTLDDGKVTQLLRRADLHPAQSGLGRIVGMSADGRLAFMPAFEDQREPRYSLYRAELGSELARKVKSGTHDTIDWFVDGDGEPVLREDFDRRDGAYRLYAYRDGDPKLIREVEGLSRPTSYAIGLAADGEHLVYFMGEPEAGPGEVGTYLVALADGRIVREIFKSGRSRTLRTRNRTILGAELAGMTRRFEFLDPGLDAKIGGLRRAFDGQSVSLESWTDDFSEIIVYVEGEGFAGDYFIFDTNAMQAEFIAASRPDIPAEAIAPIEVFTYQARDGLKIEAVLTGAPAAGEPARPLILLPHGGPVARDSIGFDWMAQFFASRGYAVLQPNFRGSSGYGLEFLKAGRGEWGAKMQDDLTDGVKALAATGRIDPSRVCIVGASYGGYAALMGGATTPDLYRCVVAIAPVTDTERMLREELRTQGRDSPALAYWKEQLGVDEINDDLLDSRSPVNLAAGFDDPVLLLHGDDDTIVPIKHSRQMEKALKRAGKSVRFVKLKDEDHWLSLPETRIQMLREMDNFLAEHLPANLQGGEIVE
jgi:dipeptidyl aminopeptidase/acylaminoacyl peptidase